MANLPVTYIPSAQATPTSVTTSTYNTTMIPLAAGATWTGSPELSPTSRMGLTVETDKDGTYTVEVSVDGQNFTTIGVYNYRAGGVNRPHIFVTFARHIRISFTNTSATAQTYFRLATYFADSMGFLNAPLNGEIAIDADTQPVLSFSDEMAFAREKIDGFSLVNKFGRNPVIDTATVPEDIWSAGGVYTGLPASTVTPETISVFSSVANDANGNTGAWTITLEGLDANWNLRTETLTLNGTTPVVTTGTWRRMYRGYIRSAGSATTNVGEITARYTTTTSVVFMRIPVGTGQSQTASYTIPAGYTGYLRHYSASVLDKTANAASLVFWIRENNTANAASRLQRPFTVSTTNSAFINIYGGVRYEQKTDIVVRCTSVLSNGCDVTAAFGLILIRST